MSLNYLQDISERRLFKKDFCTSNNYDENYKYLLPDLSNSALFRSVATYNKEYLSQLTSTIADNFKVNHVVLSAGSEELFIRMSMLLGIKMMSVLIVTPCFCRIFEIFSLINYKTVSDKNFESINFRPFNFVFLTNPNPLNGWIFTNNLLLNIFRKFPKTLFIVDEASMFTVINWKKYSLLPKTTDKCNFVVISSFSKMYGIPSLRVGFSSGNLEILKKLEVLSPTFPVSSVASLVVMKIINANLNGLRNRIFLHKQEIIKILNQTPGVEVVSSRINCVYCRLANNRSLYQQLKNVGIVGLDLNSQKDALGPDFVRLTVHSSVLKHKYLIQKLSCLKNQISSKNNKASK